MSSASHGRKVAVIGLGYVGLPVAVAFARSGTLSVAFDIDERRIAELRGGYDRTREVEADQLKGLRDNLTTDQADLKRADFYIVTVPTPIDESNTPDMSIVLAASKTVAGVLKKGDIVVYESTVYPGATEEDCVPVLEKGSKLVCGVDFHVGYSPERINPGDPLHRFETITKVVAGQDGATLETVANVYGSVVTAGVHRAQTIKVAEAAKVIENIQRDINIALMNELAQIFQRLSVDTSAVLEAAGTKWNFLKFKPGLVGGHCIGVDPYYLTHRAQRAGYNPQVILAGREVNDSMGPFVARECIKHLLREGVGREVTVLGITFKENVPDIRNSKVIDIVRELEAFGITPQVVDPLADPAECVHEYGLSLTALEHVKPADAVIVAVSHHEFIQHGWDGIKAFLKDGRGSVLDVKSALPTHGVPDGIRLWRL